jgi:alpha-galactosidase
VSRTLAFNGDSGLTTLSWRNTETGTEFMGTHSHQTACKEFRLKVDAVMLTGSARDIRLDGAPTVQHHKAEARLEIEFRALKAPLRITVHYVVPTEFAGIRQWLTLENTGEKAIVIRNLSFDCQSLQPGSTRDLIAFGNYGEEPRETFFTGRVNDVAILLENAKSGEGFAVLNEAPGYLRRTELGGWEPGFQAMYDTDLFPFERRLNPGEKFETAATSVVFYHRGTPSDPHWVLPEYVEQVIAHNKNTQPPPWIYNDWEPWNGRANNTILKGAIQQAAAIGLDLMTIDEGWEKKLGENTSAAERFPNGLKPIFQMTPIRRAKRGLWLPVSLVSETSKPYLERPEWVCRGRDGKPKKSQGQGIVMCMASPYKQLALDRISDAIREYNLDYVKLDLTTVFNTYGEEPGCYAIGHEHASAAESSVRIYESLAWLAGQLHRQFPNLLIDYTFELWGEKHLIDYGLLRVADLDWMSNVEDHSAESAGPLQVRTLLYQRGMAIPTEDMLIGNMQAEVPTWQERMATAMASAPVFLGDLRRLSTENVQQMSNWRSRFQNLRQRVALYQSFFPLGSWRQPRMDAWDGYGRFARTGEGLIVVFGNDSHETSAKIAIPGFPDGHFWLDDWSNNEHFSVEGTDLSRGWTIDLNGSPRVRILEIAKQ